MPSGVRMMSRSRLLCVVWVITWVMTVPLFHTHLPDLFEGQAFKSGVAHTVFSPDLPGEFTRCSNPNHHDQFAHLAKRVLNFPELDFVLSECSQHSLLPVQRATPADRGN